MLISMLAQAAVWPLEMFVLISVCGLVIPVPLSASKDKTCEFIWWLAVVTFVYLVKS